VDFGTNGAGQIFAHRADENAVYSIREEDFLSLPDEAWPLRDRRIWNFAVSNVARVTITDGGRVHQLARRGEKDWELAAGSQGIVNPASLDQAVAKLGTLIASAWVAHGDDARARYGFKPDGHRIAVEAWILDFNLALYQDVLRDLVVPKPPPGAAPQ
jgi:hypothetical protein